MSDKIIKINRGDSFKFSTTIFGRHVNDIYMLDSKKDFLYFALVNPHQQIDDAIILHIYTSEDQDEDTGEIEVMLSHNETKQLSPGIYYYTIKLQRGGAIGQLSCSATQNCSDDPDEVRTIIERTKFIVME